VAQNYKFTGKERDAESGNDYFEARYYSSTQARFLTPDWAARPTAVPYALFGDPQTLNLYNYVQNGPLNRIDADGHQTAQGSGSQTGVQVQSGGCSGANGNGEPCTSGAGGAQSGNNGAQNQSSTMQYVKGGGKIVLGLGLIATAAGGDVPGGVAGAVILSSAVLGGTVTTVSGVADVAGAATKTDVHEAQEALDATSNAAGLVVTAATGGNMKAGQTAATVGEMASLAMSPKEATKNVATAVDAGRTVFSAGSLLKSAWNSFSSAVSGAFAPSPGPPTIQTVPGPPQ
jgi:RHS repeat-associated protein